MDLLVFRYIQSELLVCAIYQLEDLSVWSLEKAAKKRLRLQVICILYPLPKIETERKKTDALVHGMDLTEIKVHTISGAGSL